jgi:CubicO group peptidase (beta-lactamase class C family)
MCTAHADDHRQLEKHIDELRVRDRFQLSWMGDVFRRPFCAVKHGLLAGASIAAKSDAIGSITFAWRACRARLPPPRHADHVQRGHDCDRRIMVSSRRPWLRRKMEHFQRLSSMQRAVWLLAVLAFVWGCGAPQRRQLHAVSGNEFTLFPSDGKAPPRVTCSGETSERFACFAEELQRMGGRLEVGGALALSTPDGMLRTTTRTDELNAKEGRISDDTRFPAASVTKMFLAAAAVSLARDGLLDLQLPIVRYLPELASDAGVGLATLHQLLTHTSGLGNPPQCENNEEDLADLLKKHGTQRLLAPPGAVFNYSNLGYSFVAIVIERVTGEPFEAVVRERVLIPAGIAGASFGPRQVSVRGREPEAVKRMPSCRAMWPSGGLVLSVRELARWARDMAQPESSKLDPRLLELLMAPHVPSDDRPGAAYGYGVQRVVQGGVTVFSHSGRLESFSAFVAWAPERQLGVAAFANTGEQLPAVAGLRAMSAFLSTSENWQPLPGPAHPLRAYTGTYVDAAGSLGTLRVSQEGDALVIDYLDGAPPLLPASFRFVFEPGAQQPRYVVTAVGVGMRNAD